MFGLGKKKENPQQQARKWCNSLKKEIRGIDRDIRKMTAEENKVTREIKKLAKTGQKKALQTMAKALVRSKNQKARMMESKARINSTILQIKEAAATAKVVGHMQKSAQVMKAMGKLLSVPKIAKTARELQQEMMKAGVVQEMVEDSFDMLDDEDVEEEAEEEVNAVLDEILQGQFESVAGMANKGKRGVEEEVEEDEKEIDEMKARLAKLNA